MSTMVPMYGFGGGIDNLRFRVYAATSLPASGKENDVCIITSTPIPSWEAGQVDNPTWSIDAGFVYFTCSASDASQPNLLRKNALFLKLTRCWQYESGKWATKNAYQYRNGAWVQFSTTFEATIHVTYPAGSTCTATDGVTTLTAPDTSGTWACVVHNAGTWTVAVTDKGWTESVEITGNNQSKQVDISKYYLYRNGNEYISRTGGWMTTNYVGGEYTAGLLNRNADNMEMIASSSVNQNVILHTTQKINLTNIKELTINVMSRSGAGNASGYIGAYLYIKASAPAGEYPGNEIAFVGLSGTGLFSVDVSAITGEYYVIVSCYGASIQFNQVGAAV